MKLVYVVTSADAVGGAHIHILHLCDALQDLGHQVHVLVGGQGVFIERLKTSRIPFTRLRWLYRKINIPADIRAVMELRRAIRNLAPDLVSTHSSKAGILGRLASRLEHVPAIHTAHGWTFSDGRPWTERQIFRYAEKAAANWCRRIITVCEADRELALRYGVGHPWQLVVIHNAMPPIGDDQVSTPQLEPPRLVMTARFSEQKDHQTLFRSLANMKDIRWKIDLVGDGSLLDDAKRQVQRLALGDRVHFLGHVNDVAQVLKNSQIFLLISNWEGFPRSIIEAMRAGLPVVATDVGGVKESVIDGENGFLVRKKDSDQLGDVLKMLLLDPALRAGMGARGRQRYLQHFTYDRLLTRTREVYGEVLAEDSGGRATDADLRLP